MTALTARRDARLDFRLSQDHKQMIEQAAAIRGQSLSDFAITILVEAAQRTVDAATVTRLSRRDRDIFMKILSADAEPNRALKAAASRYRKSRA